MVLHFCRRLGGIAQHFAINGDDGDARAQFAGELAADLVEVGAFYAEGQHSAEQVRLLLHSIAEGCDVKIAN